MDGIGSITWWGLTPAINLLEYGDCCPESELNVLLVGAGDCRHILKTVAQAHRCQRQSNIEFYVVENNLELYARYLLLLSLALEPQFRLGLQDKTELFLELYGNSLVRHQTMEYVSKMTDFFIRIVTDSDYLATNMPLIDLSDLKFKERDMLEGIFKFWRNSDQSPFNVEKCWDLRLRQYLGVRYDAIPNVFDWDYSMKLVDKGAGIINSKQYIKWRQAGVAFEIRDGTYNTPNKTLASGMIFKHDGDRLARRGYWGDIVLSPYIAFGIESENQEFFKKSNMTYMKTAQDVSEYNVQLLLSELANQRHYTKDISGAKITEVMNELTITDSGPKKSNDVEEDIGRSEIKNQGENTSEGKMKSSQDPLSLPYKPISVDFAKVHLLPLSSVVDMPKKSKFRRKYDIIYISNSMVHFLTNDLVEIFSNAAIIILETSKFLLPLTNEQSAEFLKKITSIAESVGCKVVVKTGENDAHAFFSYTRQNS